MVYSNVPDIADAITHSADGKTWTVRLKANLHWQDGEQLTSDDVIFTVQSIENLDAESPLAANQKIPFPLCLQQPAVSGMMNPLHSSI